MKMSKFYMIGSILFLAGVIGSAINTKMQWLTLNIGGKISMISSTLFQMLLLAFFVGLYIQTRKQDKITENPEMKEFIKELKEQEVKNGRDTNKKSSY